MDLKACARYKNSNQSVQLHMLTRSSLFMFWIPKGSQIVFMHKGKPLFRPSRSPESFTFADFVRYIFNLSVKKGKEI